MIDFMVLLKNLINRNIIFGTLVLFLLSSTIILQALLVYIEIEMYYTAVLQLENRSLHEEH